MGDLQTALDLLDRSPYLLLCAGVLWFARTKIRAYDRHLAECGEVPKRSILERLDGLGAQMEAGLNRLDDRIGEVKTDMRKEIDRVDTSYHEFKNIVTRHLLRNAQ